MTYLAHQITLSNTILSKVRKYGFAILAAEERTGKTGSFLRAIELSSAQKCLIITKKAAIKGIEEQIDSFECKKSYTIINYQSVHKLPSEDYDAIVLDEFHQGVCGYPKPSETFKALKPICAKKPIIFVSATPFSESYSQAYHALALSSYSPFAAYKNFYSFHKEYGVDTEIYINGRGVKQYNITQESRLKSIISPYIITMTRKQAGFEHEPNDIIHTVKLDLKTRERIMCVRTDKILMELNIEALSSMAEMNQVYMLSGGGILNNDGDYIALSSEKIDYIHQYFDPSKTAIMAHYKAEQERLSKIFPHVFSSTADAEGVDLSGFDNLVIYSQSFSTAKHSQRRARQANIKREKPINVNFLIADYGIDRHLYNSVSKKNINFTARVYNKGLFDE